VLDAASSLRVVWDQPASSQGSAVTKYKVEWFDADAIHAGTKEVETITTSAPAARKVRGTFQIEYDGELTDHLDYDATGPSVQDALNGLSTLRHVKVTRSAEQNGGYVWSVTFEVDAPAAAGKKLVAHAGGLSDDQWTQTGSPFIAVLVPTPGNAPTFADVSTGQATPLKSYELEDVSDGAPFAYTITGLKAGTEYRVRVSAYNDRGYNEPRLALPNKLAPPRQRPDLPTHTTLLVNTDSSLKVQWRHPLSDGGDQITKYKIEWDTKASFDSSPSGTALGKHDVRLFTPATDCKVTPCEYVISSLAKGSAYFVRVFAYNTYGYSTRGASTTPGSQVPKSQPEPPASVSLSVVSESSLRVSFPRSTDNGGGEITKYKIEWAAMGAAGVLAGRPTAQAMYAEYDVQTITASATSRDLGGKFRVAFRGHATPALAWDVSAHKLQEALEQLPPLGRVQVSRRDLLELESTDATLKKQGLIWTVRFLTHLSDADDVAAERQLLVSVHDTELVSKFALEKQGCNVGATCTAVDLLQATSGANIKVDTIVRSLTGFEQQTVSTVVGGTGTISGSFTLTFDGKTTEFLPHDASAVAVKNALEALGNTGSLIVRRRVREINAVKPEGRGFIWTVLFKSKLGNVPGLTGFAGRLVSSDTSTAATLQFSDSVTAPGVEGQRPQMDIGIYGSTELSGSDIQGDVITHTLPSLLKGVPYHVQVSAFNGVGDKYGKSMYSTPALAEPSSTPEAPV